MGEVIGEEGCTDADERMEDSEAMRAWVFG